MARKHTNKPEPKVLQASLVRAGIYLRVSTEEQAEGGYGLDAQREQARGYAMAFGLSVVAEYSDPGISGTKDVDERPGLAAALEAAKAGEYDMLILPALDRLARRASLLLRLYDEIEATGVAIVAVKERIDTSTPMGRLMRTFIAGMAEFERDTIVQRTTAGRNERGKKDGEKGGRIPYGYRRVEGLEVDPEAAGVVRRIFDLNHAGKSLRAIADVLNGEHIATPQGGTRWYASTVRVVLDNEEIYRGGKRGDSVITWPSIL